MESDRTAPTRQPVSRARFDASGALLFARYAYAPNELGYCGPADSRTLLEYGAARLVDPGLGQLARGFSGAWPYLQLIAEATGVGDPLDRRVVEAYWIGNTLLDRVDVGSFGRSLEDRFRRQVGPGWSRLAEAIPAGGLAHHSFHVFCVYPWAGLLAEETGGDEPLRVLDRCRIRWGQVVCASGGEAVVRYRPLTWDGRQLGLGQPQVETVSCALDGLGFVTGLSRGDWVSLHWGWVCDRLSAGALRALRAYTGRTLTLTNRRLAHPGPAMVLG